MPQHLWITGGRRADRERAVADLQLCAPLLPVVDAHRRLRGPYTAAGAVVRALVRGVLDRAPDLVRRYDIELLSAAPRPGPDHSQLAGDADLHGDPSRTHPLLRAAED